MSVHFSFPDTEPSNERVRLLLSACGHYGRSDLPLFTAGYNELGRLDLSGGRILEICCGSVGDLALGLARAFPAAEVTALDRYPGGARALVEAAQNEGLKNGRYCCGDALHLTEFPDGSLDLIVGQATLHHLAHEPDLLRQEFSRVLKPGGRLVFIYEPFGHNPFWAMIRAFRTARALMVDESNVIIPQLEQIAGSFTSCEVQVFNMLGYPLKSLGRFAGQGFVQAVYRLDASLMKRWPALAPYGANFNVVFTK